MTEQDKPTVPKPELSDYELSMLINEHDVCQYKKERIDELLNKIGKAQGISNAIETPSTPAALNVKDEETTFTTLKYEPQKKAQLGKFYIASNPR